MGTAFLKVYPIRLTIDYGPYRMMLEGDDVRQWSDATDGRALFCEAHGMLFPDLAWQRLETTRSEAREEDSDDEERQERIASLSRAVESLDEAVIWVRGGLPSGASAAMTVRIGRCRATLYREQQRLEEDGSDE